MASPIGVRCEAEGSGERKEMGMRKVGSTWLFRSGHQTLLKPFQATFIF